MENKIYGNEKLLSFFRNASGAGRLSHAYILEGGEGSGKKTLASFVARLINCKSLGERPCGVCESCRKISEGIDPDVKTVVAEKDKKQIGVDVMRDLRADVYISPNEEDCKVYIIPDAQNMNVQAQNVFLKTLEEPPANVYFLLLCSNIANMLPTVRSRAPSLKMQIFSESELRSHLLDIDPSLRSLDPSELDMTVRLAGGRIGEALRLLGDSKKTSGETPRDKAENLVDLLIGKNDTASSLVFARKAIKGRDEGRDVLLYSIYALRDLVAAKKGGKGVTMLFYGDRQKAEALAENQTSARLVSVVSLFEEAYNGIQLNLNTDNLFTDLIVSVRKTAGI